ncbi:MAG: hypothetical protein GY755_07855 [Chloroflexi bacterium]|nr:hypothetical protein [Chloroflexota bacterium]
MIKNNKKIKLDTTLANFIVVQISIVTITLILGLLSYIFVYKTGNNLLGFLRLLDIGSELSIPTFFSSLNLLLSSIMLIVIFRYEKINNNKGFRYWLFLSILFLWLSIDESASIHENFIYVYDYLVNTNVISPILGTNQWLPFGILFVVIVGIVLFPFYKLLSKATLFGFFLSGIIFLIGAIGFEYLGVIMLETGFVDSRDDILYIARRVFEEGFEMYGIAFFNCALYREISNRKIVLVFTSLTSNKITSKDEDVKEGDTMH